MPLVDASVFMYAFNPYEAGHEDSHRLLARLQEQAIPIIVPTLLLPEVAAAISRGRQNEGLARDFAAALDRLPHLVWALLDRILARQATDVAAQHHLRGSDSVYATVALRFGAALITLDLEQRQRVADVLTALTPVEALNEWE